MCETEAIKVNHFQHFFQFRHPTTITITGPSQVGKSHFCMKLLKNLDTLMNPCPSQIIWAYGVRNEQQIMDLMKINPNIEFIEGVPDKSIFSNPDVKTLVILDDLMNEIGKNPNIAKLFTMDSHHCNTSVIAILHNMFNQEKFSKTLSLNTHYSVLFKSKRDKGQITRVNTQMFPQFPRFLQSAYTQAVEGKPFGYLVIDSHPNTPESLSVTTGIFEDEIPQIFIPCE